MSAEWADAQRDKGLFNYSLTDSVFDAGTRDVIPVVATPRLSREGQVFTQGHISCAVAGCFFRWAYDCIRIGEY